MPTRTTITQLRIEERYERMMRNLARENASTGIEKKLRHELWLALAEFNNYKSFWHKAKDKLDVAEPKIGAPAGRLMRWLLDGEADLEPGDPLNLYPKHAVTVRRQG